MKIGYQRVSTDGQSLDLQTDALKAAGCERVFTDTATGSNVDRPGFADMCTRIRPGDTVIVWRLDRLARSLKDLIETAERFAEAGVALVSLTEGIDTTTAAGKLFYQIFGAIAEFERSLLIERTHAGLAAARSRGNYGGRKPALTRSQFNSAKKLIKAGGGQPNLAEIARTVNASPRTIRRVANGQYDRHFEKAGSGSSSGSKETSVAAA